MAIPLDDVLERAGAFFMGESPIHRAARRIAEALDGLGIPFAVVGALAANAHGHVRTTADVDILLSREGLAKFKAAWLGRGWVERFAGSKGLRDAVCNVRVDVLLAGEFPGDGLPKPICFPDPADVAVQRDSRGDNLPVIPLDLLLELKLASGMTAPHRLQDLADVMELIRANHLPETYADRLDPYVSGKFAELWHLAQIEDDA